MSISQSIMGAERIRRDDGGCVSDAAAQCRTGCCFLLTIYLVCLVPLFAMGQTSPTVHIAFSSSAFNDVNHNDAVAAFRVWAKVFTAEQNIEAVPKPVVLNGMRDIREALERGGLDYVTLATDEYARVKDLVAGDTVTLGVVAGSISEEYLLLVHNDSGIDDIAGLKARHVRVLSSARASLAPTWLETLLLREDLGRGAGFFGGIDSVLSVGKAVLPVFFGKADACVVTRSGFDTMVELNPQIGKHLHSVAASVPVVPCVICYTLHIGDVLRKKISGEVSRWHLSRAGKQMLTIFQLDGLEEHRVDVLSTTLGLLAEHERLLKKVGLYPDDGTGPESPVN